tara:strand:- start:252 stop:473 length:222 start_codon:yes stop_codon:yes gene_type:complete
MKPFKDDKTLRDIKTTDGMTDIVISAVTAWQMVSDRTNPKIERLQIFLQGDTIFTVDRDQSLDVQKALRFLIR